MDRRGFLLGSLAAATTLALEPRSLLAAPRMKRGVSLWEGTNGGDLASALSAWVKDAGGRPDLVPVWCPMPDGGLPLQTFRMLRGRGVEPMAYSRTTRFVRIGGERVPDPDWAYGTWLAGDHDDTLDRWADDAEAYGQRLILRLDHEQPCDWSPWGGGDPALYKSAWRYIRERLPGNVKLYWCGAGWHPKRMMDYYPGRACQFVGFDKYSRKGWKPLKQDWAPAIAAIRKRTAKPIIVGEFGRLRGLGKRGKWIRSLRNVADVWGVIYFDMEVPNEGVDWRMSRWMRRHYI